MSLVDHKVVLACSLSMSNNYRSLILDRLQSGKSYFLKVLIIVLLLQLLVELILDFGRDFLGMVLFVKK